MDEQPAQQAVTGKKRNGRRSSRSTGNVTLADVAKIAGVSPITVSRVTNRPDTVTPATLMQEIIERGTSWRPKDSPGMLVTDFVAYLKPEMASREATGIDQLRLYPSRDASDAVGGRVWLITGEGKPRTFRLWSTFLVSEATMSDTPPFTRMIRATDWQRLDPMPILNNEPWFKLFCKKQGNFALGFRPINDCAAQLGLRSVLKASARTRGEPETAARASPNRAPTRWLANWSTLDTRYLGCSASSALGSMSTLATDRKGQ